MHKITIEIKQKLSFIIKIMRIKMYEETKSKYFNSKNPYAKENFCKDVCHFHTLTKLENHYEEDYIHDDSVYRLLLKKLNFNYDVSTEQHIDNMNIVNIYVFKLLLAVEYIDDQNTKNIRKHLSDMDFKQDCIAFIHLDLLEAMYNLQFLKKIDEEFIERIRLFKDFFQDIYQGLYHHVMGLYHINKTDVNKSKEDLLKAKEIYDRLSISKGVINTTIMALYMMKRDYLNLVNLCLEMEKYYIETDNNKRLFHVYSYLSDYYLIVNSTELARTYYNKRKKLIEQEKSLKRLQAAVDYNWALHLIENYEYEEAMKHLKLALKYIAMTEFKIRITNVLLFVKTKLKKDKNKILALINENKKFLSDALEQDVILFKYFQYKYENNRYYRKYALTKVMPIIKANPSRIDFLLLLYEDLYN